MGAVSADINAVEIVEKGEGYAVDDFMVELPPGSRPDSLVSACASVPDVEVIWVSHYPEAWGLQSDVDVLDAMTEDPEHAEQILTAQAPKVFRANWALLVDRPSSSVVSATELAPELDEAGIAALGDLSAAHERELTEGWTPGWGETLIVAAPFRGPHSIVLGRHGGPEFKKSELARLRHLAALAQ